ncbi:MAG: hypothetical protein ACI8S6_003331, partial [Myxococcota bacterium]
MMCPIVTAKAVRKDSMNAPLSPLFLILMLGCREKSGPNFANGVPGDQLDTAGLLDEDADGDGFSAAEDCDDSDAAVNPDAAEVCDGVDNDCDGDIDVGASDAVTWYADEDGDDFGSEETTLACDQPSGYTDNADDCDDSDSTISPDGEEICDGLDNDCDTLVDSADPDTDKNSTTDWHADTDSDGYG